MVWVKSRMRVSRVISMMYLRIVVRYRQAVEPQHGYILLCIAKLAWWVGAEGPVDPDLADSRPIQSQSHSIGCRGGGGLHRDEAFLVLDGEVSLTRSQEGQAVGNIRERKLNGAAGFVQHR